MPGMPVTLGPFTGGLHNSAGTGEYIGDDELFEITNLEVDTDGSLANRPPISTLSITGSITGPIKMIGTYLPASGSQYVVISYGGAPATTVGLIDVASNTLVASQAVSCNTVTQYKDNLYVVPAGGSSSVGGFWNASLTWTAIASMPKGDDSVLYKDRLYIVAGITSTSNTSLLSWSALQDATTWNGTDIVAVDVGNGQRLTSCILLSDNIILFKEHSTYRFTHGGDPKKADLTKVSSTIGAPSHFCATTYDNNNIYVMHDNSVYELYNFSYTKLSSNIDMDPAYILSGQRTDEYRSLTQFRNRLFVRFYGNLYVYSLLSNRWSQWVTTKPFSRVVGIPQLTGDVAFTAGITTSTQTTMYSFKDDRITGAGIVESYTCSITTKTYDLAAQWSYKVLFWWGMTIATMGNTTGSISVPNSSTPPSWDYQKANYTWDQAKAALQWDQSIRVIYSSTITPKLGAYARKFLKFPKKLRFRQAYWQVSTPVVSNSIGDASVRIYDLVIFVLQKETVVKDTT